MVDRETKLRRKRESYWRNREETVARRRARYANDPEYRARVLAQAAEYKQRNDTKARVWVTAWHARHLEEQRAYKREWRARNADRVNASARLDRLRRRGSDELAIQYATVLMGDPCAYCGGVAEHVDHIEALAAGGSGDWTNLTAACGRCNRQKMRRSLLRFLTERDR